MSVRNSWNAKKIVNIGCALLWVVINCVGIVSSIYTVVFFEFTYAFNIISGACLFLVLFPTVFFFDAMLTVKKNKQWDASLELGVSLIVQFLILYVFSLLSSWNIGSLTGNIFLDILILGSAFNLMVSIIFVVIFVLYLYFGNN